MNTPIKSEVFRFITLQGGPKGLRGQEQEIQYNPDFLEVQDTEKDAWLRAWYRYEVFDGHGEYVGEVE